LACTVIINLTRGRDAEIRERGIREFEGEGIEREILEREGEVLVLA
jgi:hypothetical protein